MLTNDEIIAKTSKGTHAIPVAMYPDGMPIISHDSVGSKLIDSLLVRPKAFGAQGYVPIPEGDKIVRRAYTRVSYGQAKRVGKGATVEST